MWVTWYLFSTGYELHYRNENIKKKITNRKKGLISSIGKKKVLSYIINGQKYIHQVKWLHPKEKIRAGQFGYSVLGTFKILMRSVIYI